jgi:Tfp pilus assembly PilM family ATPase
MVFAKHVAIGGDAFTRRVAEATKLPYEQARDLRLGLAQRAANPVARLPAGVVAIGTNGAAHPLGDINAPPAATGEALEQANAALEEPTEQLVSELELCVRYYESCFPGKHIDRAIFVGGESRNVQLCQKIAQQLALPATLGDPLARLLKDNKTDCPLDLRQPQPGWAIAVGLGAGMKTETEGAPA